MNFIDQILVLALRGTFGALDWLLVNVFSWHWLWFAGTTLIGVLTFFAGHRLKKFNHPDYPLASPAIRVFCGGAMHLAGATVAFLAGALALVVVSLVLIGASTQAVLQRWDQWAGILFYTLRIWPWIHDQTIAAVAGAMVGAVLSGCLVFLVIPAYERGKGLRDIRQMMKVFMKMKRYNPLSFIDLNRGIFVGLEDGKHPIHVPIQQFHETHTQVLGASGSGKGIALGVLAYQFICADESVIIFDPKGDRRLPLVAALGAKKSGKNFWFIDLRPDAPAQFNLLAGANAHEIEELFVSGLGLQPTNGDGDYYRGVDQDAAASVGNQVVGCEVATVATALDLARKDPTVVKAENFVRRLKQVSELAAIQTSHDFDLEGIVARGDVLYILGATDNHRVKTVQMMLLLRLLQIIKRHSSERKIALFLDEFKHLLCPVSLDALGTVRELGCHAILAHQSMGDLGGCPGLKREDVEPRVVDNTTLKLVYRINDAKASADFAARSGKQRTHSEGVRELDQDRKDQRAWMEVQQFRMSDDLFTHLHRPSDGKELVAAGVLFGYKTARLIAVSPINVKGTLPPVQAAPPDTSSVSKIREALI